MEERLTEIKTKYSNPRINPQTAQLTFEIDMLKERLNTLEYLKQSYEKIANERTLEIEQQTKEINEFKSKLTEKNYQIEEITNKSTANEKKLMKIVEEHRSCKIVIHEEITEKNLKILELDKRITEQCEENERVIKENKRLKAEIGEKEGFYSRRVAELEGKLEKIEKKQRVWEKKIEKFIAEENGSKIKMKAEAVFDGFMSMKAVKGKNRKMNSNIEERLLKSEKKIKGIERLLKSTRELEGKSNELLKTQKFRYGSHGFKDKAMS